MSVQRNITVKPEGITITWVALNRIVAGVAALGLVLGAIGLADAYRRVGFTSSGGITITVAAIVAAVATFCTTYLVPRPTDHTTQQAEAS